MRTRHTQVGHTPGQQFISGGIGAGIPGHIEALDAMQRAPESTDSEDLKDAKTAAANGEELDDSAHPVTHA